MADDPSVAVVVVDYIAIFAGVLLLIWGWILWSRRLSHGSGCGIRTDSTRRDYIVWLEVNELFGRCLANTGALFLLLSVLYWFLPEDTLWIVLRAATLAGVLVVCGITTFFLVRRKIAAVAQESMLSADRLLELL